MPVPRATQAQPPCLPLITRHFMKILLALLTFTASSFAETDLLIYGSTPGGIAAAVSAAKQGREVTIIEPTERIGGMLTNGLSYSDFRTFESITGFYLDFSNRVSEHYYQDLRRGLPPGEKQLARNHGRAFGEPARARKNDCGVSGNFR